MRTTAAAVSFFVLAAMIAQQASAQQACPTLVVSTNDDVVNGDTSSPCALIANPGPDGISLREALLAANNDTGYGTITITFAPALAGQTITPSSGTCCYVISRDSVAIVGLVGSNGQPAVTINAANITVFLFSVTASNFTLKSMNIIDLGETSANGSTFGVYVRAGDTGGQLQVSNTLIEGNVFSNTPGQASIVIGVVVGSVYPSTAPNAVFANTVIANNSFSFTRLPLPGDSMAVKVQAQGTNSTVQNVSISNNTFTTGDFGIEIIPAYNSSGDRILNTSIVANSFSSIDQNPILIDPSGDDGQPSTNNTVDGTTIERNVFIGNGGPAIDLDGGFGNGSTVSAIGNATTNTTIVDNLIAGDTVYGGISIAGGRNESSGNTISGVSIINNTIANYSGCGSCGGAIDVNNNYSGGTNNTVSGVTVLNTILWNNTPFDINGDAIAANQVTTSLTAQPGFAGVNGNIASNPQFVNAANNFALQASSPARGAGTSIGAPAIDIDCQPRGAPPSIGAYEFEGPDICPATYSPPLPLNAIPAAGQVPLAVAFRAIGLTIPLTYTINFGDGTTGPVTLARGGCPVTPPLGGQGGIQCSGTGTHTYTSTGTYTATLVDASGGRLGGTVTITVGDTRVAHPVGSIPPPTPPPVMTAPRLPERRPLRQ